jgi:hypothetical protein
MSQNKKENDTMKNRIIHFKATAGLVIRLLLACFAAVFISAPIPAIAADRVPFNASFTTEFVPRFTSASSLPERATPGTWEEPVQSQPTNSSICKTAPGLRPIR